jgi:hypothetical protein
VPRLFRYWWVLPVGLAIVAGLGIAIGPNFQARLQQGTGGSASEACSAQPCAAPKGFEIEVTNIRAAAGITSFDVSFKNHTAADLGTTSFRLTSPRDFQLRLKDGRQVPPAFSAGCPDWGELHVERGGSAGPVRLCFRAPSPAGARVVWGPDLGWRFDDVQIPLTQ